MTPHSLRDVIIGTNYSYTQTQHHFMTRIHIVDQTVEKLMKLLIKTQNMSTSRDHLTNATII